LPSAYCLCTFGAKIKTMSDPDKTNSYSDNDKTRIYCDLGKQTNETVHQLKVGDSITLNSKDYQIIEIISVNTGEAVIYKIKNENQEIYALKLYYEFSDPGQEPNNNALERIRSINDVDILNLHDYGTGTNKYLGKFCFEISDFACGLDLLNVKDFTKKYNPEFIVTEIIPQIFLGIMHLHQHRIYHCDLKPQNIFFLDEAQLDIVIGDYGSAKTFEFDEEKQSRKTTTVKGTDFYLPPEQARGFISEKNDYYSFGMILLHLLYPEAVQAQENHPKTLSHNKLKKIIERQFEGLPIIDFNPQYKKLNSLIEGLTLADFNLRWGKEEVQRWLKGEDIHVVYNRSGIRPKGNEVSSSGTLKFGKYVINTPFDLRDYILNDPNWYTDLVEDKDNWNDFINWVLGLYNGDKRKRSALNRIVKEYSQEGLDLIADAIIRFFIPDYPVLIGLKTFNLAESKDLKKSVSEMFVHLLDKVWTSASEKDLKLYLFRIEFALRQLKEYQDDELGLMKLLYKNLGAKGKIRGDFYSYRVYAFIAVTKDSKDNLEEFLFQYLPAIGYIQFKNLSKENTIYYSLEKSLSNYYKKIGIDSTIEKQNYEGNITTKFPEKYNTFDDFVKILVDENIKVICEKHQLNINLIDKTSYENLKKDYSNVYRTYFNNLKHDFNKLNKEISDEARRSRLIRENLQNINSIVKNELYHKIGEAFQYIDNCRNIIESELQLIRKKKQEKALAREKRRKEFFSRYVGCLLPFFGFLVFGAIFFGGDVLEYFSLMFTDIETVDKSTALSKIEMIAIKGGTYKMGDPDGPDDEKPLHKVTLNDFALSKYEITNEQFADFLNDYGSDKVKEGTYAGNRMIYSSSEESREWGVNYTKKGWLPSKGYEKFPVVYVTWYGANEYCKWAGGRLPSEAEWNFAAIGGNKTQKYKYSGSSNINEVSWYKENSETHTHEVGTKSPNELGLYDMSGNVYEWCQDWYDKEYYRKSPKLNPVNNDETGVKVLRGGSYYNPSGSGLPCNRTHDPPSDHFSNYGFRLCKNTEIQIDKQKTKLRLPKKERKERTEKKRHNSGIKD
jgi:formylglycine-generating enzyme